MRWQLFLVIGAGSLFAQPNARELVRQSVQNGERSWLNSFNYYCLKDDITRQLGSGGTVKSVDEDVYQIVPLGYGVSYEEHIKHNNEPLPREEQVKVQRELARLQAASPAEKLRRRKKLVRERSYMKEVADAFDFRISGEENLPTGPAWVLQATPRAGYQPRSRYAHMFPFMGGTLWIDKKDVQWVKADAIAMNTVSFGFFIARLAKGSHILIEQMELPGGAWAPKRIEAKASARTMVFFNHNFEENITYSDYRKSDILSAER